MKEVLKRIGATIVIVVIALIVNYFLLLPYTINSLATAIFTVVIILAIAAVLYIVDEHSETWTESYMFVAGIALVIAAIIAIVAIVNTPIFRAKSYANIVETVEDGSFEEDIPTAEDAVIMDIETAQNLGSRVMGQIDDVSQYVISDEYNMITYQGRTYRISPLEYASDIKALGNKGITGYVLVDCQTQEASLVKLEDKIMYSPSAVFSHDLTRHILSSYPTKLLGKEQFEIDEDGTPYYIVPTYKNTIGLFSGEVLDTALVVNAITGEITEYSIDNIPDWVEHVDSISHLTTIVGWHYKYQNGYFNSFISQKDVKALSYDYRSSDTNFKGYSSIKTNNSIEYFTGIVSVNSDESILGFIFMNPKNGKVTYYNVVGAEESSAMSSAEALVQNYGYEASYPFVVNVGGVETYFIALKDKTGTNKAYALVNVANYTISAQASSKEEAIKQYTSALNKKGTSSSVESSAQLEQDVINAKITEVYTASENGTTYYYYYLEGYDDLFVSSILLNRIQVKLKAGDTVTITAEYKDGYYEVTSIN